MKANSFDLTDADLELLRIALMVAIVDAFEKVTISEAMKLADAYRDLLDRFGGPIPTDHVFIHPVFEGVNE